MREGHADRGAETIAEPRPAAAAVAPFGPPIPETARPSVRRAVRQEPVVRFDRVPHLCGEHRWCDRSLGALALQGLAPLSREGRAPGRGSLCSGSAPTPPGVVLSALPDAD